MVPARVMALILAGTAAPALAAGLPAVTPVAAQMPIANAADGLAQGRALLAAGNIVQAISAYRAVLASDPASVAALNGLGVAYDRMGRADLARQQFELALAQEPDAADILYNLGWSLYRAGKPREAIGWLQRASAGRDARAAAAARRALALVAVALQAPAADADVPAAPLRTAAARIDMASSGEAVLVLPTETRAVARPQLAAAPAASVPKVAMASVARIETPVVTPPPANRLHVGPSQAKPVQTAAVSPPPARMNVVARAPAPLGLPLPMAKPAPVAEPAPAPATNVPSTPAAPTEQALAGRLGDLASLTIPIAPLPSRRSEDAPAAAPPPRLVVLGDAPPPAVGAEIADADPAADLAGRGLVLAPAALRLRDLAALPLLASARPVAFAPWSAQPDAQVQWRIDGHKALLAELAAASRGERLVAALRAHVDTLDSQRFRMAIARLELLIDAIEDLRA